MTATLVVHNDPFRPAMNVDTSEVLHGLTVCETLINAGFCTATADGIQRNTPFIVMVNGELVLQDSWNIVLNSDDFIQVTRLPRGGGGGSNIGNILGAIVIAVTAYFTFGLSLAAVAAVGAVAYVGLSLIAGPMGLPKSATSSSASTSPTYSLSAQGNSARLLQAMPRVYGRMRTYPDLAAQPYSEYQGNEQFLYQLFCISLGRVDVERIEFDGSAISNFEDAQYQIINPGQAVTLFPDNVVVSDSVTGQTMLGPNDPNYLVIGPYIAVPAGKKANFIAVDITNPSGVGRINDEGKTIKWTVSLRFEYQEITDTGQTVGLWKELTRINQTFATTQAQTASFKIAVPEGRYQVRGYRETPKVADNRTYDTTQWVALRAYLTSTFTYGNCTLLAVKARATNSLNNTTARKLSVIAKGLVQKWDPVNGWSEYGYSSNPAWIAADILRDNDYGRGLPTSRLNMAKFFSLSQTWDARNDQFNGVFDTSTQLWDAVTKVLRVGRAVPMYYAGVIDIIRDEPATLATAKFNPGNMLEGSFEATYSFFDINTPDHVVVQYTNPETWEVAEVVCALPGETALTPSTVDMTQGVTNRDQAYREGMSLAAGNRDRRRSITFSTLTQGLVLKYNGLIRINHDVPQWGYSGRVMSFDVETGRLRSSEPMPFDTTVTNVVAFANKDGSELGPFTMLRDPTTNDEDGVYGCMVSTSAENRQKISTIISNGFKRDFTFYSCGPTERQGIKALVVSAKPDSEGKVAVECINYADSVHSAETGGDIPAPSPESNLPGIPNAPIVDSVIVVYTVTVGEQNIIASPARGAIYYEFQAKLKDTNSWAILGQQDMPTLTVHLQPGEWDVRVRGIARNVGPWASWSGTIEATSLPTAKLDSFTAEPDLWAINLKWSYDAASASIAKTVEIYAGLTNVLGQSNKLVSFPYPANAYTITGLLSGERRYLWARVIDTAGRIGPWFNDALPVTATSSTDVTKILDDLVGKLTESQFGKDFLARIDLIDKNGVGSVNERIALVRSDVNDQINDVNTNLTAVQTELQNQIDNIADLADSMPYKSTDTYAQGKAVLGSDGKLYQANKDVPVKTPPPNAAYWTDIGQAVATANALSSRVQTVETTVTTLQGKTDAQATLINGLRTDVDGKATSASVNSLTNRVSVAEGSISSQGTAITGLQTAIAGKADSSTVSSLSNTVTQQGTAITSQGAAITSINTNLAGAGAENLVYNPSFEKFASGATIADGWIFDAAGGVRVPSLPASGVDAGGVCQRMDLTGISATIWQRLSGTGFKVFSGQTFAASVYVRATAGLQIKIQINGFTDATTGTETFQTGLVAATGSWQRLQVVFTVAQAATTKLQAAFVVYGTSTLTAGFVEIDRYQIETGTAVTGWRDNQQVIKESIAANATATTALTGRVSQAETGITSVSGQLTQLTNSVGSMGGDNLLPNSSFETLGQLGDRPLYWQMDYNSGAPPSLAQVDSPLPLSVKALRIAKSSLANGDYIGMYFLPNDGPRPKTVAGQTYTLSAYVRMSSAGGRFAMYMVFVNEAGNVVSSPQLAETVVGTSFVRLSMSAQCPVGATRLQVYPARMFNRSGAALDAWLEVDNIQLQEGAILTAYSPSVAGLATESAATSSAVTSLQSTVSQQGTTITSVSGRTTALENVINSTVDGLATKASASALSSLSNRVTSVEGTVTSQSSDIVSLKNSIGGSGLDPASGCLWNFDSSAENWAGIGSTLSFPVPGIVRQTSTGGDPYFQINGISVNGALYSKVRISLTRRAGNPATDWDGACYYATTTRPELGEGYVKRLPNPNLAIGASIVLEYDMSALTAGGNNWITSTIVSLRFDLGNSNGSIFDIDWIVIGRAGVAASASAVSSLTTTVTQQGATIASQGTTIASHGTTLTSQAQQITQLNTSVGNANAAVQSEQTARTNADNALGQRIDTVQSSIGNTNASVQQISTAQAGIQNQLNASYTVKLGITQNGRYWAAGFGLGLDNAGGYVQSQFIVSADSFYILNANASTTGTISSPFAVVNGQVFIQSALIQQATITNLLVSADINSSLQTAQGLPMMQLITRAAQIIMRHASRANTYTLIDSNGTQVVVDGVLRVRMGTW